MIKMKDAFGSFSVDDLAKAKAFYSDVIGLEVVEDEWGLNLQLPGGGMVYAYPKEDHEPASFTVLNVKVKDIDKTADALADRGIKLERYDGFDADEKGIVRGNPTIAWIKDPAGNVLGLIQD